MVWMTDPKTKKRSVTLTFFSIGFVVSVLKLLVSGVTLYGLQLDKFSGTDFAVAVGALGAVYTLRRAKGQK